MRRLCLALFLGGLLLAAPFAMSQGPGGPGGPPDGGPGGFGGGGLSKSADVDDLVTRMMSFDQSKDGKLSRSEVTDTRLLGLFDRADVDKDGVVTKAELTALAEKEYVAGGFGGPGGPGGFGPPPGFGGPGGPGGFGGPGGPGGPMMRPGDILPAMLQQRLGLSAEQKAKLAELQAEVDGKLAKILTDEQKSQLKQMRERGPGGPGGPRRGGPGGGGPGGPPPRN